MRVHVIIRRIILAILPESITMVLGKGRPRRGRLEYGADVMALFPDHSRQYSILDFGCGDIRIGEDKNWDVRYIDAKGNSNWDGRVDIRSLDALDEYKSKDEKFDVSIAISSLQYLSPKMLEKYYALMGKLVQSENGLLYVEIDNRDLMSGIDYTGSAPYCNEYQWIANRLNERHANYLATLNLYVNCININEHIKMMIENYFNVVQIEINMDSNNENWIKSKVVPINCLRARIKAVKV